MEAGEGRVLVTRSFVFALDPNPAQADALRMHVGAARFAYNALLADVTATWEQRTAEASYGVPEELLTSYRPVRQFGLNKYWNTIKDDRAPWWNEAPKDVYTDACRRLESGLRAWFDSRSGRRVGKAVGFPRFKRRGPDWAVGSTRYDRAALTADRHHVQLPKLGEVRTRQSTRRLARLVEAGRARVLYATVAQHAGRWQVSLTAEVSVPAPVARPRVRVVGADVGISTLVTAATADRTVVLEAVNPRSTDRHAQRLRRAQRQLARMQGPDRRTGQQASNRWRGQAERVARLQAKVAAVRRDAAHKATTALVDRVDVLALEDLNVTGMLSNRRLAKALADAAFAGLHRQLRYKAQAAGVEIVTAGRFWPSSKTCSGCGAVKAKLPLFEREYQCGQCGLVCDRDVNAAANLAAFAAGLQGTAGGGPVAGRGGLRETASDEESSPVAVAGETPTPIAA